MNRTVLIRVATPAVVLGVVLLGACLLSAWHINRLQSSFATTISENVTSLEAAQDLEIEVRQLRFHCFVYLLDPNPARLTPIEEDHERFEQALAIARRAANAPDEEAIVRAIEAGYQNYHHELTQLRKQVAEGGMKADMTMLADSHPVRHVVDHCRELLQLNKSIIERSVEESAAVSRRAHLTMLLLGLIGPLGGLSIGYGMARGLSRSIAQLHVHVRGLSQRLDVEVGAVNVQADADIHELDQQLQHVVHRVEEVAERLQQQQLALLRTEQLAAVGQLAAGVAHEVRNPLASIKMLVEAARRARNRKPLTEEDLRVIHSEITRLESTVQEFLDFARPTAPRYSHCDLRDVVTYAVELVRARAKLQQVIVEVRCPEKPVPVEVDRSQFETVLVNLFLNALDAMPRGGRLEVEVAPSAGGIRLDVRDTGTGIQPEILNRLFTPFVSGKPTGTGLGLSLSQRIVREHGGRIVGRNRPEGGACFRITLPSTAKNGQRFRL